MNRGGRGKHRGGRTADGDKSNETIDGYAVSYVPRLVKCGKAGCKKCQAPDGGHGPYWYKVYRTADGKVKTKYHGKSDPDENKATASPNKSAVKLDDLIAETVKQEDGYATYFARDKGTYRVIPDEAFFALDEGASEDELRRYRVKKRDFRIAAAVDMGDPNFVPLPAIDMVDQVVMLEAFMETVADEKISNSLRLAFMKCDSFENYYEILTENNLLQAWFSFRDDHYNNVALHWCEKYKIDYYR